MFILLRTLTCTSSQLVEFNSSNDIYTNKGRNKRLMITTNLLLTNHETFFMLRFSGTVSFTQNLMALDLELTPIQNIL